MNRQRLMESIKVHEGYSRRPYQDSRAFWTVGYGHLIHDDKPAVFKTVGELLGHYMSRAQHDIWLENDIAIAVGDAKRFCGVAWGRLTDEQREVVAEMAYQLGGPNLFKFVKFQEQLQAGRHDSARAEMLDSQWARDFERRATILANKYYRI